MNNCRDFWSMIKQLPCFFTKHPEKNNPIQSKSYNNDQFSKMLKLYNQTPECFFKKIIQLNPPEILDYLIELEKQIDDNQYLETCAQQKKQAIGIDI